MELSQVKSILLQTVVGEMLTDGMGCSEPILSLKDGKLIDNFILYFSNKKACTVSGPFAKIGLQADSSKIDYLFSCENQPFSISPRNTMTVVYPDFSFEDYSHYENLYAKIRKIAYKSDCVESEKQTISEYMSALKKIIAPEMMKLYEEMVPSFFTWVRSNLV